MLNELNAPIIKSPRIKTYKPTNLVEKREKKGYNELLKLTENIHWAKYNPNEDIHEI